MIRRLLIILQILKDNDLYVKPEKCIFFTEKVEFLGFIIEDEKSRWIRQNSLVFWNGQLPQP